MKNLIYFLAVIITVGLLSSCEKDKTADISMDAIDITQLKSRDITMNIESSPISGELSVTPSLIPGSNNGGNRTCDDVAIAFDTEFVLCGDKIDYEGDGFMGNFPEDLGVKTDGTYVTFDIAGCLEIDGMNYKVGAVIVKGSEQANVYYYPGGANYDYGLSAPITSSGEPAGLSNLTFCFVPCNSEPLEFVFAVKAWGTLDDDWVYGLTKGIEDIYYIGYYDYIPNTTYKIYYDGILSQPIGDITVEDIDSDGKLEVVIDNVNMTDFTYMTSSQYQYNGAYLYVGTAEDFNVDYKNWPYEVKTNVPSTTVRFDLPF